ncbi:MAG: adenylate kinase [Dehalococcoidia bacterium]
MNIVLLGSPGAGKGTQAKLLARHRGVAHIATGDLFRANARDGTELGKLAETYMDRGDLVPDEVTIRMLLKRLEEPDTENGAVFDGFPRNLAQARALDEALANHGMGVDCVVLIEVSDEEAVARLSTRWICRNCGAIYHRDPGTAIEGERCENCGGELYQREDDRPEVVRSRLDSQKPPLDMLDYYRQQGKLQTVNGQQDTEAVTAVLLSALDDKHGN